MKKICKILSLFVVFLFNSFGQEIKLTVETPTLSSGAEYSQFIEQQKILGNTNLIEYNGVIPLLSKTQSTEAITTIEGINFDEDAANSGFYHIPPDPIGAAGLTHLVSVTNTSIEWFTKAGVIDSSKRLGKNSTTHIGSFFQSLTPLTGTFDPKVIYDQYSNRFVVVALEQTTSPKTSRILLAVSKSSDPNSGWWFASINSNITINNIDSWADYPGLSVGSDAVYITANMFEFVGRQSYQGGRLWIIAKTPLYSGGNISSNIYDYYSLASGNKYQSTYQPTQMFGTPPSGVGTFLVLYSGLSSGTNESVNIISVNNPLSSPTFIGQDVPLLNIDNTTGNYLDAPQLGTSTLINTNDRRAQNAVWRNNALWTTFTVVPNSGSDANQVTAHWVKINTTTLGTLSLSDQGDIGGEDIAPGAYTFFPSIAVNSAGDAIIGFSASAPTIYPGAYYAGRYSTTPTGTVLTAQLVKAGLDYYIRLFNGTRNRWGDYSGACVDPSDNVTFYTFNQYSLTRGTVLSSYPTQDGRWGTVWGIIPASALPVELSNFTAKIFKSKVNLSWRTETEINNYGFEIERKTDGNWQKIEFVKGNGNSNSPKEYSYLDKNPVGGSKFHYRLKQIDNDGQFEYSKVIEVENVSIDFGLYQNYPNPFNPSTMITYALPHSGLITLKVYDILGNEISTLVNEVKSEGVHSVNFDASGLPSGVYIYQIQAGSFFKIKKMTLMK